MYAPGVGTPEQIAALATAVAPKPLNVLIGFSGNLTLTQFASLGVRRLSVGGALARTAWGALMRAAKLIKEEGRFDAFAGAASGRDLDALFGAH